MTIIYTFLQMVAETHEKFDKAKMIIKARVKDLTITVAAWTRCIYEKGDTEIPVIIKSNVMPEAPRVKGTMKTKVVAPAEVLGTDQETEIATSSMSAQNGSVAWKYRSKSLAKLTRRS